MKNRQVSLQSLATAIAASFVALGLMFWARAAYQIRTLPERIMEWLLVFIPADLFERGIETFGPVAKDLALYGVAVVMAAALLALGVAAVRRGPLPIAVTSIALWLFAMA